MCTSTDTPRGDLKARTYLPGAGTRDELLDFAEFIRKVEAYLAPSSSRASLVDPQGNTRQIPEEIFRILGQVTNALAAGEGIMVVPQGTTMTTQQAADFLGISRPTLVRLLEAGDIAFDKPGRHRRVRLEDLMDYEAKIRTDRKAALRDLQRANLEATVQVGSPADIKRLAELDA